MQRLLFIAAGVIVVLGIGIVAFFVFFNQADVIVEPQEPNEFPEAGAATSTPENEEPQSVEVSQPEQIAQRLVQITKGPVAPGIAVYAASSSVSTDPAVSFVTRENGNLYQYLKREGTLTRTSNKTIPGIQEAVWRPDGSLAYVRYLSGETQDTINTYALPKTGEGGYFLSQNIATLAASASNILSLATGVNGSVATLSRPDGSQSKQVFSSPLASLRIGYLGTNQYLAYTKPAGALSGFAFLVSSTGTFDRIAGPLGGLVAVPSPSGKWVILSHTSGGLMRLSLVNVATRESIDLPLSTIADKCAWARDDSSVYCGVPITPPRAVYPDDWYQGAVSFSDRIWRVDVTGRFAELLLDFATETDAALDATSLMTDPGGTLLVFRNKNDGSLWSYEL